MDSLFSLLTPGQMGLAFVVALGAGVVKGTVGFALPMILVSGLNLFLPPEIALAGLILPTLVTNGMQALRQGLGAAWEAVVRFRVFLGIGVVFLMLSAQLVALVPASVMLLMIGVPIFVYALTQLLGRDLYLHKPNLRTEAMLGAFAGFIGGFSGVWGPPTVAYLTALKTEKSVQMRVQGVIYGLGALALTGAHLASGVLGPRTLPFSMAMAVPAVAGMLIGTALHNRIDQEIFRKATLAILMLAALSLVWRGLTG